MAADGWLTRCGLNQKWFRKYFTVSSHFHIRRWFGRSRCGCHHCTYNSYFLINYVSHSPDAFSFIIFLHLTSLIIYCLYCEKSVHFLFVSVSAVRLAQERWCCCYSTAKLPSAAHNVIFRDNIWIRIETITKLSSHFSRKQT